MRLSDNKILPLLSFLLFAPMLDVDDSMDLQEKNVAEVARISSKIAVEQILGQMSQVYMCVYSLFQIVRS